MLKSRFLILLRVATGLGLFFAAQPSALADGVIDMPQGVTALSYSILGLQHLIFYICVAIVFVVFSAMIYSIFAFRKSKGSEPETFYQSISAEIIWTAIPLVILIGMAIPSAKEVIRKEGASRPVLSANVTGWG